MGVDPTVTSLVDVSPGCGGNLPSVDLAVHPVPDPQAGSEIGDVVDRVDRCREDAYAELA